MSSGAATTHSLWFAPREGRRQREAIEVFKIDVAAIHHVEGSGLDQNLVKDVDVMHLAIGNADERGDIATQVEQGMHLHRTFVLAKPGPG